MSNDKIDPDSFIKMVDPTANIIFDICCVKIKDFAFSIFHNHWWNANIIEHLQAEITHHIWTSDTLLYCNIHLKKQYDGAFPGVQMVLR